MAVRMYSCDRWEDQCPDLFRTPHPVQQDTRKKPWKARVNHQKLWAAKTHASIERDWLNKTSSQSSCLKRSKRQAFSQVQPWRCAEATSGVARGYVKTWQQKVARYRGKACSEVPGSQRSQSGTLCGAQEWALHGVVRWSLDCSRDSRIMKKSCTCCVHEAT